MSRKPSPWWDRHKHEDRQSILHARSQLKAAIRRWFDARGFIEVDTGCLQISPGNEVHLHAFKTEHTDTAIRSHPYYLHTSPEFACKKLLAAGEHKIYTFAPVFRNRERGPLHHPEFMMLEWYRTGEPYEVVMEDCIALLKLTANEIGNDTFVWRDNSCSPKHPTQHLTVKDAFLKYANIDLSAVINGTPGDRDLLATMAGQIGITTLQDDTWSDIFSRILASHIETHLGSTQPTLLKEYPIQEAALAQVSCKDPTIAERFELYCCGVELANGFGELNNPRIQRERFEQAMVVKQKIYGHSYPIDDDFIEALEHMPPASGVALGFDRLVMLATHATHIDQVIWTPMPPTD